MLIYSIVCTAIVVALALYAYKQHKTIKDLSDIEERYDQVRKDLGWYKYALDNKEHSYAKIEKVAADLKKDNVRLKQKIEKLEKDISSIPEILGSSLKRK